MAREQIAGFRVLDVDFFPRESHLITFRDPWSFPILYRPDCSHLVKDHMEGLARKVRNISHRICELPF
jgi:syntaxin-binding protein 1